MTKRRMLVGLIGANIQGSMSPALFADAFGAAGIDGYYHLLDADRLAERPLPQLFGAVKTTGFAGVNVTYPFKQDIIPLLDAVDPEAAEVGAVNTVAIAPDGRTTGYNFDRRSWRNSFLEVLGPDSATGKTVVQVGAGGAGRAVAFALMDLGVAELILHDLDRTRADALKAQLSSQYGASRCRLSSGLEHDIAGTDGIVNATQVGMRGFPGCPVPVAAIKPQHWAADVIYTPMRTEFLSAALAKGGRVLNGGGMCVHQAVAAFQCLTGVKPDMARLHRTFAAAVAARPAWPQRVDQTAQDRTMRTSIATVCLSGGLSEKLQAIAAAGFRGVEIFENDLLSYDGTPADVAKEIADLGLILITFQPFRDFEGMPDAQRRRTFDRAERKFDLMQELGCASLLVCSNVSPEASGGIDRAAADFRELGERAAKRGLKVGFEALAWGRHINDYRDAWEVVRRADHPAVGLVLDSFHIYARKTDLRQLNAIPGDRIFLVQLADAPWLDMDVLTWSRHFRCFPAQGDLPLVDFMAAVAGTGYQGDLSLEIFNDQFRAGPPRAVAVDGQRSLIYLTDQLREKTGLPGNNVAKLPPRSQCRGVEFIEFAVDDHTATALGQFFTGLGFRAIARHKSKAVTRWTQGAINLVINQEKEGFAHSHYITHGPSVCALGLKVANAAATLDRAEKLRDTPFRQKVGPGELEVPAVRGMGGSLLYFIDQQSPLGQVWDIEFVPIEAVSKNKPTGLAVVDHISQSMQYDEMLSWLLFYTSLLDVQKMPQLDITDPCGIVRSQVVQTADGALRIALNASQSQHTQSSRFLSEYFGSGVQHIAFATDGIVAAARQLEANGIETLAIPENYYDDLEARVDLPAEQLKIIKANNILYDRDDAGEYFQLYTPSFKDLFFIEIVERRGYRGFGAVNAAIRLHAQSRLAPDLETSRL